MVGSGRIADAHLTALKAAPDLAETTIIAGLPQERPRLEELAHRFSGGQYSTDISDTIASPAVDAVIIAVPNDLHESLSIEALCAGKHVLVEKPMATTLKGARAMVAAAKDSRRTLMVAQCRRFFEGAQAAKARMGDLGRPISIVHMLGVYNDGPRTAWWRSSTATAGLAIGLNGPHLIDTVLWLIDEQPRSVFTKSQRFQDGWEGEDEATIVIDFSGGSVATGHLSLNMPQGVNERWVVGPNGMMRLVDDRNLWVNGRAEVAEEVVPYIGGDSSFNNQFREFASAIAEGRRPLTAGEDILTGVAVMEAALASARLGVPVSIDDV
ncbi:MAG TPA: Gfo/Idh/MocA family oxidoreductase [Arthrobacter sp.]|nr:Gfo/Idh/MocA family oxidoreductase [Arthrobacter sp.]